MNQTSLAVVLLNLSFAQFLLLLLLLPLGLYIIIKNFSSTSSKSESLPPGPKPWPIIGNILQVGKNPHISFANFAEIHGPLISLKVGTQLLVVGSSAQAATEILKTHDCLLSGRHVPKAAPAENDVLARIAIVYAPQCIGSWKFLRALCRTELFSSKALESHVILRQNKAKEMVEFLESREGKVMNVGEVVFDIVFNTLSNLLFSKDLTTLEDKRVASLVRKIVQLVVTPNVADFYPIFARLDPQRLKSRLSKSVEQLFATWEMDISERRERFVHDAPKRDFLDVFLANGFDDDQINWLAMELFIAGTDTVTAAIEWAMAELLKNKEAMQKARLELETKINKSSLSESNVCRLPYLNACVKETLRLHPPVPLLLPRRASESCEIMNYTIPKNSKVFANVWAIGRDPSVWKDASSFKPERFLGSNMGFKGRYNEYIPFGSGRRFCPGLPLATKLVPLLLASLIHRFDWSLPHGEDSANLDMNENFGLILHKEQPLLLVPKTRQ